VEGDDFRVLVCEDEKIAVVGLPRIFAGVADGGGIAVAHVGERGEQIGFAAEGGFLLAMDSLDSERGVLRIEFDLVLDLGLRVAANDEESKAGERGGQEDEGKRSLVRRRRLIGLWRRMSATARPGRSRVRNWVNVTGRVD